jgi:hypothetical protein
LGDDLVILNNFGVLGFNLLGLAVVRKFPAMILTDYASKPEVLEGFRKAGVTLSLSEGEIGENRPLSGRCSQISISSRMEALLCECSRLLQNRPKGKGKSPALY